MVGGFWGEFGCWLVGGCSFLGVWFWLLGFGVFLGGWCVVWGFLFVCFYTLASSNRRHSTGLGHSTHTEVRAYAGPLATLEVCCV